VGRPAPGAEFGHGPAIITSDGLLGEAFALFSADPDAIAVVADAMVELGIGEATELSAEPANEDEYMTLARHARPARYFEPRRNSARSPPTPTPLLSTHSASTPNGSVSPSRSGDDVLDAVADPEALGKPTGHDAALERPSVVQVTKLTPEEANDRARSEVDRAIEALDRVEVADPDARKYLLELAEFVVERER